MAGSYKHGRYSSVVPIRLAAAYEAARRDPELLELRDEAAIISAQIEDAIARLDAHETGALWLELRDLWANMISETNLARKTAALNEIGRLIERGASDAAANREIRSVIMDKARVVESERRRLVEAHEVLTIDRVGALVGALSAAILEEIPDRERAQAIFNKFERLLGDRRELLPQ